MTRCILHLAPLLLLAACTAPAKDPAGPPEASAPPVDSAATNNDADAVPFVATGTEPGWRLEIGPATLTLDAYYGETRVVAPMGEPARSDGMVTYRTRTADHEVTVVVRDAYCTNAMSGKPFPKTVEVTLNGDSFDGCGGDSAALLTGPAWQVRTLNGVALPEDGNPTLAFAEDGRVSGYDGCNRFHGRYAITGIGVSFSALAGTRMACRPREEARAREFLEVLENTRLFRIDSRGVLVLEGQPGGGLTARR